MNVNIRDAASGVIFIVIAGLFALGTTQLAIGSPLRMGPGFFPLMLAAVLALLGVIILLKAFGRPDKTSLGRVPWRGAILILIAPIIFGLTVRGSPAFGIPALGLVPAVALVILISSFASVRSTVKLAVALTLLLTLFCLVVFQKLLGLPIPPFAGPLESLNPYVDMLLHPFAVLFQAIGAVLSGIVNFVKSLFGG